MPAGLWRPGHHQYPQHQEPALACLARAEEPLPRALHSFCEYADTKPRKTPTWFAGDESRPLLAFAGIWTTWRGTRGTKANPVEGEHLLFGFLTTEANAVVAPIHRKAMPVILRNEAEFEGWLTASADEALALQRPLPDDELMIVATGEREDKAA